MLALVIILSLLLLLSIIVNVLLIRKALSLQDTIDIAITQTEESLDMIDTSYKEIASIANLPIAIDDPNVRKLMKEIKYLQKTILLIANKLVKFVNKEEIQKEVQQ